MPELPRISEAEWDVMHVVWADPPVTAQDVAESLGEKKDWSIRTVKTLLGRLVKKGALDYETDGKRYLYHPTVAREACVRAASRSFLDRVLGGRASPLLAYFLREGELDPDELAELRRLLEERERER